MPQRPASASHHVGGGRATGRHGVHGHAGGQLAGQRRGPPSDDELRVGIRIIGHVLHVRPVAYQRFNSGGSITLEPFGREGWQVGVFERCELQIRSAKLGSALVVLRHVSVIMEVGSAPL